MAAGCGGTAETDGSRASGTRAAPRSGSSLDARLRARFHVLRRARTTLDQLPAGFDLTRFPVDRNSTRLAYSHGISHLYAGDAGSQVCLLDSRDVINNCWSKRDVLAGNATMAALCARNLPHGKIELAGLVPDGVSRVTVVRPGRRDVSVEVDENAWLALLTGGDPLPLIVRWRRSGRVEQHLSGIPEGTKYEGCSAQEPVAPPAARPT